MCGIAGIYALNPIAPGIVAQMTAALAHRGPDAQRVWHDGRIALGHTRLSIIDLSTSAHQPFASASGRYTAVFNGEIYNFQTLRQRLTDEFGIRFRTESDTEVLVEAFEIWGAQTVSRLEGMFAAAVWDARDQKLTLFRDRVGKKPLYIFTNGDILAFASELKGLLQLPNIRTQLTVALPAVTRFLHLGYIPEPLTIYQQVQKFPAGHYAIVGNDLQIQPQPYWSVKELVEDTRPAYTDAAAKQSLSNLLTHAVQKRLVSDVPLGAFLSGGTDSSLVSAIASRQVSGALRTFSIGFKESKHDERAFARAVANHLNTQHTEYVLEEKEAVGLLETYLRHFDEPFADTSAIPTMLVSHLARRDVTVALTGDGGDELFQGYGAYTWANRLATPAWQKLKPIVRWTLSRGSSRWQRVSHLLESVPADQLRSHIFSQEQYLFSQQEIRTKLWRKEQPFDPFIYDESFLDNTSLTEGEKQAIFDLQYYLKDDLLVKVDRASMYYALECRSPLLDHQLIAWALNLDVSYKVRDGKAKWLLKELLRDYIPDNLVDRPKWGFSVPLSRWLRGELRYLLDTYLTRDVTDQVGLLQFEYIDQLKQSFLHGKDYLYNRVWAVIVLHQWWLENHKP